MAEPTLEGIPAELKSLILRQVPNIQTLHNLVRASPTYHQAYLLDRQDIIYGFVQLADMVEANTAIQSEVQVPTLEPDKERIIALLDSRRRHKEIRHPANKPTNIEETIKLLHFQRKLDFLVNDYCLTVPCPPWKDSEEWNNKTLPLRLTTTERARLLRAFYRLQTYCNILGAIEFRKLWSLDQLEKSNWGHTGFEWEEMWSLLFGTMPPWEIEEFCCAWAYVRNKYVHIFAEIADDLSEYGPRYKDLTPQYLPITWELYPDSGSYEECLDNMISIGPCFLYKVLSQESYEKRRDLMDYNMGYSRELSFPESFYPRFNPGPPLYPADKYERDDIGSFLPLLPPLEQPNLAWTRYWLGKDPISRLKFTNFPEPSSPEFIDTFGHREGWEWGYAFWDSEKLIEWKTPFLEVKEEEEEEEEEKW